MTTKSDKSFDELFEGFDAESILDPGGTMTKGELKDVDGVKAPAKADIFDKPLG